MITIHNADCIDQQKRIKDESVDLGIFDPPFGIGESKFDKHYNRKSENVISGYREAPKEYEEWTLKWMTEAKRVLKANGSMYVIIGHSNLRDVLNAAYKIGLKEINHIIWKFNFGVNTKNKFVTSHYHVLYYGKSEYSKPLFNTNCRFGQQEKNEHGGSKLYDDMQDVFVINKEYSPNEKKNQNKLPRELIEKLIMYSSAEGDMVCDFFMGNFTTAYCAHSLGRNVCGYELNKNSYDHHMKVLMDDDMMTYGKKLRNMKKVENIVPENQGKKITPEEENDIKEDYLSLISERKNKKQASEFLQKKYGRGRFSIKNILDKIEEGINIKEEVENRKLSQMNQSWE